MGRHAYPLSPEALEEIRRLVDTGKRRHAIAGAPSSPSTREIADHLFARKFTDERVDPKVLWRACRRHGISLPGRPANVHARRSKGASRARKLKGTARGLPVLEMELQGRAAT